MKRPLLFLLLLSLYYFPSCNDDGNGNLFTEPPETPAILSPFSNATTNQCITVVWTKTENTEQYRVQLASDTLFSENGSRLYNMTLEGNLDAYTFEHLESGFLYARVKAVNGGGESTWSSVVGFEVAIDLIFPCYDPPGETHLLLPTHNEPFVGVYDIFFDWSAVPEATHYQLQIGWEVDSNIESWVYDNEKVSDSERTVQGFPAGKTFVWRVRAFTYSAVGAWSNFRRFTIVN